ncbi:MAG: hypothetical protein H0W53_02790, partial [Acidobacteria bacterium]|nr:hypothetical protein [Acidobacteriota bacterium]
ALALEAERQKQEEEQRRRAAEQAAEHERQLREKEAAAAKSKRAAREKKPSRSSAPSASVRPAPSASAVSAPSKFVSAPSVSAGPAPSASAVSAPSAKAPSAPSASGPVDQWSDFRASVSGASAESIFRLMPIDEFARRPGGFSVSYSAIVDTSRSADHQAAENDALSLMRGLKLPLHVASFDYPRQCRIRRVRVMAPADEAPVKAPGPVIVSRRVLGELRETR